MAALLRHAYRGYIYFFEELIDPRVKSWPLLGSPFPCMFIVLAYLAFVIKIGPEFMKNRKPYNLDKIVMVYNAFQVIACGHIFYIGIKEAWGWRYRWICEPVDFSNDDHAVLVARYVYYYFLLKVTDLLDTVIFVFRKKFNQITFLHVYHHTGMVGLTWGASNYYPGGHGTFVGVINCFVHVVMYSYYLLTVAFPQYKKSMWWKKYITQLQIVQFLWLVIHFTVLVFQNPETCHYPRWSAAVFLPQNFFMLILFIDFYIKSYIKKPKIAAAKKQDGESSETKDSTNGFVKRTVEENGTTKLRS